MINHSKEQNPEKSKELFKQGMEMRAQRKQKKSLELFNESLEYDHSNLDAIRQVTGATTWENIDQIILILERSIKIYPEEYPLYVKLAGLYESKEQHMKAMEVYEEVMKKDPDYIAVYKYLALLYSDFGELEKSVNCLKQGIERFPEEGYLWYGLSLIFLNNELYYEASIALKQVIDLGSSDSDMANVYLEQYSYEIENSLPSKESYIHQFHSYLIKK